MFSNVFESDLQLPEKVCIVAPGHNGRGFYGRIPRDYYQIAVSKVILCGEINAKIWMMNTMDQDWFAAANHAFRGIRIFRKAGIIKYQPQRVPGSRSYFFFDPSLTPEEKLHPQIRRPVKDVVRGGATIAGCAVQIAYNFGAKDILLCGVDMSGDQYWDGSHNRHPTHGKTWSFVPRLQTLLDMLIEDRKIRISSLSPTVLKIPEYKLF